ncbi:hypothetical protein Ndes2437B_g00596 [Nannochloris sp. 'desiccata']
MMIFSAINTPLTKATYSIYPRSIFSRRFTPPAGHARHSNLGSLKIATHLPGGRSCLPHVASSCSRLNVYAASQPQVTVRFVLARRVDFGKSHCLVGDISALGSWNPAKGPNMTWGDGDKWSAEISVPAGSTLEFKVIEKEGNNDDDNSLVWEPNYNHAIAVPDSGAKLVTVTIRWGSGVKLSTSPEDKGSSSGFTSSTSTLSPPAERSGDLISEPDLAVRAATEAAIDPSSSGSTSSSSSAAGVLSMDNSFMTEDRLPTSQWSGRETVFMQKNDHSGERSGIWNTSGLDGIALKLVEGDRDAPSWLNKLSLAKTMLVDDAPMWRPDQDTLAHAFVYLSWVATGALACVDAGGHRRPNHHADISKITFRTLEWVVGERAGQPDSLVARRLQTRLPSFAAEFTQSVPLTRIRDIAHRGDIPQHIKSEIKHTIQNKLHRNAGPEDLVATEALLAKVTANEVLDDAGTRIVERFLANKETLDNAGYHADDNAIMDALHGTASVRALLAAGLSSGLRNDAPDRALSMRQKWRLAEIRAEDYAFVLLSRFINNLEERGGANTLAAGSDGTWGLPLGALVIALRHVGLCGFQPAECMALERELATWQRLGGFQHREEALRLRATLHRTQRLAEAYCQLLLDTLSGPAAVLGAALGVDEECSSVFAESEIRANVVFQLSKLTLLLQRATTQVAQTTPWDVVMAGNASGVLLEAATLDPGCLEKAQGQDAIVLVGSATGDEELGSLGFLKGVILRHTLPHLSHLGVRARQEKVPFVTCDDDAEIENCLRQLVGKKIMMKAVVDGVVFELAGEHNKLVDSNNSSAENGSADSNSNGNGTAAGSSNNKIAAVKKVDKLSFIPLEAATVETCGSKAAVCGELLHLASECAAALQTSGRGDGSPLFEAANGVVLPFGCLESALEANKKDKEFAELLSKAESVAKKVVTSASASNNNNTSTSMTAELAALTAELASIITSLRIPQTILLTLGGAFDPGSTIIVRSSANVEDLVGMSGAGLYESVPNINPRDPEAVQSAVHSVWASLHTRRALLARAAAGVEASSADMAVLCQQQFAPELSFVLHTAHPITRDTASLVAEVAPGLGETLASGTRGSAWRLEVERDTGNVKTLAFANFSSALLPMSSKGFSSVFSPTIDSTNDAGLATTGSSLPLPGSGSGALGSLSDVEDDENEYGGKEENSISLTTAAAAMAAAIDTVIPCVVDYSQQELSWSEDVRSALGKRLAAVGRLLESEFDGPQDVEGCVVDGRLFIVQTRPQP